MRSGFRLVSTLAGSTFAVLVVLLFQHWEWTTRKAWLVEQHPQDCPLDDTHWIGDMIDDAETQADNLLKVRSTDLRMAAAGYRERRGRHPPPGYDKWYEWGKKHGLIVAEGFFDQVYEDLEPYWSIEPQSIRDSVASWPSDVLQVRNGELLEPGRKRAFRARTWAKMLREISHFLPDLDMAVNLLDEPRILAPSDSTSKHLQESLEQKKRMMSIPLSKMSNSFQSRITDQLTPSTLCLDIDDVASFHNALNASCPQASLNATSVNNVCTKPQLLSQHGFLMEPATISFSTSLIPVFSAAKLSNNNDILLPEPAYYFDEFGSFSANDFWSRLKKDIPWSRKKHGLIWRGAATGGVARENTWTQSHRHRFVIGLNATLQKDLHQNTNSLYDLDAEWLRQSTDVAFTSLSCEPERDGEEICSSLASRFKIADSMSMHEQYGWKYLPDIDGNTLSGRFRAFMLSNSAPMKATIFSEWHDKRLVPWSHFIPFGFDYEEIYDVMAYFLGSNTSCAHDNAGNRIAKSGKRWAEQVLSKEDMILYVYLTLLEYARVVDDNRDFLGYVGDLM
jgi:hypothetical protein